MTVRELVEIAYKFTMIEIYDGDEEEPVIYGMPKIILKHGDSILDRTVECYCLIVDYDVPILSVTLSPKRGGDGYDS